MAEVIGWLHMPTLPGINCIHAAGAPDALLLPACLNVLWRVSAPVIMRPPDADGMHPVSALCLVRLAMRAAV